MSRSPTTSTAILAHATYNDDCSNGCDFAGGALNWTIPTIAKNGGTRRPDLLGQPRRHFPAGTTHLPNVVVVTGPGSNCEAAERGCRLRHGHDRLRPRRSCNVTSSSRPTTARSARPARPTPATRSTTRSRSQHGQCGRRRRPGLGRHRAILAHATYNADCSHGCTFAAGVLSWTIASIAGQRRRRVTLTFSVTLDDHLPDRHHPPPERGRRDRTRQQLRGPERGSRLRHRHDGRRHVDPDDRQAVTGNTAGTDPDLGVPAANVGDTLHYTLTYHGQGLLTNAVITDVLPRASRT